MALVIDSVPAAAASSLAPGFRFHPTDEELVRYYLRRKVCGKAFRFDAISDVDVYKVEPWDLPGLSRLKTRDLEWYFFSVLDKKYGNGARTNRATDRGYWKTTGKDRTVHHRSQLVGMKKTLVYHCGRAPRGERTNWVMHEYRLIDQELEKAGIVQDAFVLCRIFHKSGSGPKNGEKYGAPFMEEEWEDDELVMVSKQEDCAEELPFDDDCYLDASDIDQILGTEFPEEDGSLPFNSSDGDNVNSAAMINEPSKLLDAVGEDERQADSKEVPEWFDLPVHNEMDPNSVKHEYIGESSNSVNFDVDYLLDEPYFDATTGEFQVDERSFFEADDFDNAFKMDDYTSYFDQAMDNSSYIFDSIGNENVYEQTHQSSEASQELFEGQINDIDASSKQKQPDRASDMAYPFLKKASCMLESISAPPAFASEFPTKYMPSSQSSSSVANMLRIRNMSFSGSRVDWPMVKHGQVNIVLSFDLGQPNANSANPHQIASVDSWKGNSAVYRSWFYCIFLWILVLSLTFKISSFISPRSFIN